MGEPKQAETTASVATFTPLVAEHVDLRVRPYPSKATDPATKQPIMVDGLALVIGDQKIDYFGKYGGWEKWQALGEACMRFSEDAALAKRVGTAIQRAYIKHLATTNGTKRADVGPSLL